jgi:hypothetical protein
MNRMIERVMMVIVPAAALYGIGPAQVEAVLGAVMNWLDKPLVG